MSNKEYTTYSVKRAKPTSYRFKWAGVQAMQWLGQDFESFEEWGAGMIGLHSRNMTRLILKHPDKDYESVPEGCWVIRDHRGCMAAVSAQDFHDSYEPLNPGQGGSDD